MFIQKMNKNYHSFFTLNIFILVFIYLKINIIQIIKFFAFLLVFPYLFLILFFGCVYFFITISELIFYKKIPISIEKIGNKIKISKFTNIKQLNIYALITSISIFPSGKFILVAEKMILIFDINYNIIQIIPNAHNNIISYVCIKDEKKFSTCSYKNIKIWFKKDNKFIIFHNIIKAHNSGINKLIYNLKGNLYSCSDDYTIKIWEENKITYKYQSITSIVNNYSIASIYLIYDKNIMITSGENGTIFFNLHNNNYITSIKEAKCDWWNSINRLNEDQIIIGGYDNFMRIISISQKKIIATIDNKYRCHGIYLIKEKGIFLTEENKTIKIYRCDNFKLISNCNYAHEDWIYGFIGLKDGTIASYSRDGVIKIWQF